MTPYKWVVSKLSNFLTSAYNTYCSCPELGSPSWDLRISRGTFIEFHSLPRTNPSPSQYPNFKPKLTWNWLLFQTNPNQMTLKVFFFTWLSSKGHILPPFLVWKPWVKPTYRVTVLLGRKLGCRVSIKSTSSHATLILTCCLLSSLLDLSAEQWQLSTIRSGQFRLLTQDSHSRAITHRKISTLMVDRACCVIQTASLQVTSFTFHVVLWHDRVHATKVPWITCCAVKHVSTGTTASSPKESKNGFALFEFAGKMVSLL